MGSRWFVFSVLFILTSFTSDSMQGPTGINQENTEEQQTTVNNISSRASHNNGLLVLPPVLTVDITSLVQLAVQKILQNEDQNQFSRNLGTGISPYYRKPKNLNYVKLGNKQYFLPRNQKASWFDGLNFCRSMGMDLVSIESMEESDLIVKHIDKIGLTGEGVFISAHKIGRSTFLWLSEEPLVFENWHPGEPSQPATDHCLIGLHRGWYDRKCEVPSFFMCEEQ